MKTTGLVLLIALVGRLVISVSGYQDSERLRIVWSGSWRPDGLHFAAGGTLDTLKIFSSGSYDPLMKYPVPGTITKIKWHPLNELLAISVQDGLTRSFILNTTNGNRISLNGLNDFGARAIGWSATGEYLAVGDYDGILSIFDKNGKRIKTISTGQKGLIGLDWHPAKDLIVTVGENISLYNLKTDSLRNIEDRAEDVLMLSVEWHPSGRFFATGDYGDYELNFPALLQYWKADGENLTVITGSKAEYRNLSWSADGKYLASASDKLRLWNVSGELIEERPSEARLWGIDWNRATDQLLTTDENGNIFILEKGLNFYHRIRF